MTDPRLERVFGAPELLWLLERARRRLERGEPLNGSVSLSNATGSQREAIERLLGRRPRSGTTLSVSLDEVDAVVSRSALHGNGLRGVVEALTGPVVPIDAQRAAQQAQRDRVLAPLHRLAEQRPELAGWMADAKTPSLVMRLPLADVERLCRVLAALPAEGMTLARFAATIAGDPHALDLGSPLATVAESAIAAVWYAPPGEPQSRALRRRELWDSVGVLLDELSSTVLGLNLPVMPGSRPHALTSAAQGEPLVLTLRQLVRDRLSFHHGRVFICENPAVIAAAADELAVACPPMVCTGGQPSTAASHLLQAMVASGVELHYHGDFDWGGIRIANLLRTRVPWAPWRFSTEDYEAAAVHASSPLGGIPVAASWDAHLQASLLRCGVRVHEELVLPDLLGDLRSASEGSLRQPGSRSADQ